MRRVFEFSEDELNIIRDWWRGRKAAAPRLGEKERELGQWIEGELDGRPQPQRIQHW